MNFKSILSNFNNFPKTTGIFLAVIALIAVGAGGFFLFSQTTPSDFIDPFNTDPPIHHSSPGQWLPTQTRTAALRVLHTFERYQTRGGLYPRTLICDGSDFTDDFSCDLALFKSSEPIASTPASELPTTTTPISPLT